MLALTGRFPYCWLSEELYAEWTSRRRPARSHERKTGWARRQNWPTSGSAPRGLEVGGDILNVVVIFRRRGSAGIFTRHRRQSFCVAEWPPSQLALSAVAQRHDRHDYFLPGPAPISRRPRSPPRASPHHLAVSPTRSAMCIFISLQACGIYLLVSVRPSPAISVRFMRQRIDVTADVAFVASSRGVRRLADRPIDIVLGHVLIFILQQRRSLSIASFLQRSPEILPKLLAGDCDFALSAERGFR